MTMRDLILAALASEPTLLQRHIIDHAVKIRSSDG